MHFPITKPTCFADTAYNFVHAQTLTLASFLQLRDWLSVTLSTFHLLSGFFYGFTRVGICLVPQCLK